MNNSLKFCKLITGSQVERVVGPMDRRHDLDAWKDCEDFRSEHGLVENLLVIDVSIT